MRLLICKLTLKPRHAVAFVGGEPHSHSITMKAQDAKKEKKKAPQKTAKEKKLAKQEKKAKQR